MVNQQFATAVHILLALAYNKNKILNSETLAASVNTNPVVIRRTLSLLTKAGLVTTTRGQAGGVRLSKEPQIITLKDIYSAVEPKEMIQARTQAPLISCPVSCSIPAIMSTICGEAHDSILKYLGTKKLSDLAKKINKLPHA